MWLQSTKCLRSELKSKQNKIETCFAWDRAWLVWNESQIRCPYQRSQQRNKRNQKNSNTQRLKFEKERITCRSTSKYHEQSVHILCMSALILEPKYANVSVCFHTYLIYWLGIIRDRVGYKLARSHTITIASHDCTGGSVFRLCFWISHVKIKCFWHINSVSGMWRTRMCAGLWWSERARAQSLPKTHYFWLCECCFFPLFSFLIHLAYKLAHYGHSKKVTFMLWPKSI